MAFETDFDYLMHDLAPFLLAVRGSADPAVSYEPPVLRSTPDPDARRRRIPALVGVGRRDGAD